MPDPSSGPRHELVYLQPSSSSSSTELIFMEDVTCVLQNIRCGHVLSFAVHTGLS